MSLDYNKFKGSYTGESIGVEFGLKAVAKQAGMYLGSKGLNGLKYQIGEIIDNSIDELNYLNSNREDKTEPLVIELELYENGAVRVKDCGRGVPVGINPKTGRPSIESVFESTSAGGKSYSVSNSGYGAVNRGVHGAGAAVVAATSSHMKVIVTTIEDDCTYTIEYGKQERIKELTKIGHMSETKRSYGTEVIWKYDEEVFKAVDINKEYPFKINEIENMLKLYCYPTEDIRFIFSYTLPGKKRNQLIYDSNDYDLADVIKSTIKGPLLDKKLSLKNGEYSLRVICGVADGSSTKFYYTNGLVMVKSTQATVFPKAMNNIIRGFVQSSKIYNRECPVSFKAENSLSYALMLSANNPEYTAQHKDEYEDDIFEQLFNREFKSFLVKEGDAFLKFLLKLELDKYKSNLERHLLKKSLNNMKKVVAVSRDELTYIDELIHPKLPTYSSDLIIVEGISAASNLKTLLKPNQALVHIRGLFPNAYAMKEEDFASSDLFKGLKTALALPWKRIILLSDPDPIGGNIQNLLLVMFSKYYIEYLEQGKIFILKAPLYIGYSNNQRTYIYTEHEKNEYAKGKSPNTPIEKHKGLGALSSYDSKYLLDYEPTQSDKRIDQIVPTSMNEGLPILESLYGKNLVYRKNHILTYYATHNLVEYFNKKKSKKESQTISFDFVKDKNNITKDIGYTGNIITESDYMSTMDLLNSLQGNY